MSDAENIVRSHCNQCGRETRHLIVSQKSNTETDEIDTGDRIGGMSVAPMEVSWTTTYSMLECCGCGDVSLKRQFWFSEDDPDSGPETTYYPPRVSRRRPTWFDRLPEEYQILLNEIYFSLHADNRALSAMGTRAVIDLFIRRKVGDQRSFAAGLSALVSGGHILERDKEILEAAIDVGHAAAHRTFRPTADQLNTVMDIVEHLLQQDLIEDSSRSLRSGIPPRGGV